jgi:hypothetical protein
MPNYFGWCIFCKEDNCIHRKGLIPIWLPIPNPIQTIAGPTGSPAIGERRMFLCPGCKQLFDYTTGDVGQDGCFLPDGDVPQSEPRLVCLDFPCDDKGCGLLYRIRAIREPGETSESFAARIRSRMANVHCQQGHQTVMPHRLPHFAFGGSACQMI